MLSFMTDEEFAAAFMPEGKFTTASLEPLSREALLHAAGQLRERGMHEEADKTFADAQRMPLV
ncbi:hypothetical protein GGQ80_002064 [Sphingomonas jinjuensis]|uniref:Uncharacterized protein n=1 Tax=Sphingomonas jinjuensis TaxID=535907 RepID=A0A840FEJ8_9SPHN|nr:hypothetical protein [Sphingomonas jinjuensis]MBB4154154.1 hypothetical protein [Sphingomonas jinjuensis]